MQLTMAHTLCTFHDNFKSIVHLSETEAKLLVGLNDITGSILKSQEVVFAVLVMHLYVIDAGNPPHRPSSHYYPGKGSNSPVSVE